MICQSKHPYCVKRESDAYDKGLADSIKIPNVGRYKVFTIANADFLSILASGSNISDHISVDDHCKLAGIEFRNGFVFIAFSSDKFVETRIDLIMFPTVISEKQT